MRSSCVAALAGVSLLGCARAGNGSDTPDGSTGTDVRADSSPGIDGPPGIDANCGPIMMEMLTNEAFDASPLATGWTETRIDSMYGLVVSTGGPPPMSPGNKVWLAGLERPAGTNNDALTQDIAIPAGATSLVLTGSYWVETAEFFSGVYDFSRVELVTTANVVIEEAFAVDDDGETTAWTPFSKTFASPSAGQTVRLRLLSTSDGSDPTSFFYDSLSLKAMVQAQACP